MRASFRALLFAAIAAPLGTPATAATPVAAAIDQSSPEGFVQTLADQTFAVLRSETMSAAERRQHFEAMVRQHFAIRTIGDRLIRRYRPTISAGQYDEYVGVLPDFIVGTYATRLEPYGNASFKVVRSVPRGDRGEVDVVTRVTRPGDPKPFSAVWSLTKDSAGRFRIANLTVEGVNVALSQEADFAAMIDRQGFDQLVAFMRTKAKSS